MANEVFLSYRRSDAGGHARGLHEYLQSRFPPDTVFFDRESIRPGDDFPQRLASAVGKAAAVLVLIGPDWLGAKDAQGRRRLHEAGDFVRAEVALALSLGTPLLPVLFDEAPFPVAAELPADLVRLCDFDLQALGGKNLEYRGQRLALVDWLAARPGVPAPGAPARLDAERKGIMPEKLPYLCDRSLQSAQARKLLRAHAQAKSVRPVLLVVHGDASERHDAFVETLRQFSLPRIFGELSLLVQPRLLHCHDALPAAADSGQFAAELRSQIAHELGVAPWPGSAEMMEHLARAEPDGVVAMFSWLASECRRHPQAAIDAFTGFWAELPDFAPSGVLMSVLCLKYDDRAPARLWQSVRALAALGQPVAHPLEAAAGRAVARAAQSGRLTAAVLPRLRPVNTADLQKWALFARQHTHNLRLSDDRVCKVLQGQAELPMDLVLPSLDELLKTS